MQKYYIGMGIHKAFETILSGKIFSHSINSNTSSNNALLRVIMDYSTVGLFSQIEPNLSKLWCEGGIKNPTPGVLGELNNS